MTFTARIRPQSVIWNLWKGHARTGGAIHGVLFSWISGSDFASKKLTPAEVNALKSHPDVLLEIVAETPPAVAAAIEAETVAVVPATPLPPAPTAPSTAPDAGVGLYGARSRLADAGEPKPMPSLDEINARRRESDQRRRDAKRQK